MSDILIERSIRHEPSVANLKQREAQVHERKEALLDEELSIINRLSHSFSRGEAPQQECLDYLAHRSHTILRELRACQPRDCDIETSIEYGYSVRPGQERLERETPEIGDDPIEQLYDELAKLNLRRAMRPDDAGLDDAIRERFARLRQLQGQEAAAIEQRFTQSLALPIGTGQQLLKEAKELIRHYANSPASD